jgi:hypothetical protein
LPDVRHESGGAGHRGEVTELIVRELRLRPYSAAPQPRPRPQPAADQLADIERRAPGKREAIRLAPDTLRDL